MASQNSVVLLNRLLSLKESSPFLLVLDSLAQTSHYFIQEVAHKFSNDIIYLSFETLNKPKYANDFIDCSVLPQQEIIDFVQKKTGGVTTKSLVIIDSLNYIENMKLTEFITSLILPNITILGVFHTHVPQPASINYPSSISLLNYVASSIFELEPKKLDDEEAVDNKLNKLQFPVNLNLNSPVFKLILTNRRKSGRSLTYQFIINTENHTYEPFKENTEEVEEDESLLKDLTTFNLTTNSKQKLAREQVELPFMQAQEALGSAGGAIVYEFEKDDDYDEEDPYEDPF